MSTSHRDASAEVMNLHIHLAARNFPGRLTAAVVSHHCGPRAQLPHLPHLAQELLCIVQSCFWQLLEQYDANLQLAHVRKVTNGDASAPQFQQNQRALRAVSETMIANIYTAFGKDMCALLNNV